MKQQRTAGFIPGRILAEQIFHEAVRPVLADAFPGLRYTAALIGHGSEVLGFDTEMSTDHHWGPRAMIFLSDDDAALCSSAIKECFRNRLPVEFRGFSTNFSSPDPQDNGTQRLQAVESGPVNHRIELLTIRSFFSDYLDIDPMGAVDVADWFTFPQQKLRSIKAGAVYHDDLQLQKVRTRFDWYPREIWMYLMASEWSRISQEEAFVGRAGSVGDELGSRVIAARLVQHLMRLCFLMERQYAPYSKWFGTAFSKLSCADRLGHILRRLCACESWQLRESALAEAYEMIAGMHNALGVTPPIDTTVSRFWNRPFRVIHANRFSEALYAAIRGTPTAQISRIGGIDVFSDSTDLLEATNLRRKLRLLYS